MTYPSPIVAASKLERTSLEANLTDALRAPARAALYTSALLLVVASTCTWIYANAARAFVASTSEQSFFGSLVVTLIAFAVAILASFASYFAPIGPRTKRLLLLSPFFASRRALRRIKDAIVLRTIAVRMTYAYQHYLPMHQSFDELGQELNAGHGLWNEQIEPYCQIANTSGWGQRMKPTTLLSEVDIDALQSAERIGGTEALVDVLSLIKERADYSIQKTARESARRLVLAGTAFAAFIVAITALAVLRATHGI